jgi:hypothetical protein
LCRWSIGRTACQTAAAEAKANEILAASVSNDPDVLVSKCLGAAREVSINPLGWWPNTSVVPTVPAR